ncbi:MAG: HEAT repeat domain-containing protein [Planctomycetes bacterium]|nr:HEAT repeat domain-containing protein [Planctomycetota bacterium]
MSLPDMLVRACWLLAVLFARPVAGEPPVAWPPPSGGRPGQSLLKPAQEVPGAEPLDALRERLFRSENESDRALAADRLVRLAGPEALATVSEALGSPEDRVVLAVVKAVAWNRDSRFVALLLGLLASDRDKLVPVLTETLASLEGSIQPLLEALQNAQTSLVARTRMLAVLGRTRSKLAVELLLAHLDHPEEAVRNEAVLALRRITRMRFTSEEEWGAWWAKNKMRHREDWLDDAFDALDRDLASQEAEVAKREAKIRELKTRLLTFRLEAARKENGGRGEAAVLAPLLEDPEYRDVRRAVLEEVVKLGRERAKELVPVLIRGLSDTDLDSVVAVCATLGAIGDERSVEGLRAALTCESSSVRKEAALALGKLGGAEAGGALAAALSERERLVLLAVLDAVKMVKPRAAVPRLRELLSAGDNREDVVRGAVEALGEIGDHAATADLIAFLKASLGPKERKARWTVANSLGKLADPAALDSLAELLSDEFPDVRQEAAEALGKIDDPAAAAPLRLALRQDKDPRVRELAALGLSRGGGPDAIPPLIEALGDAEPKVAVAAWDSIKALYKGDTGRMESVAAGLVAARRGAQAIETLTTLVADPALATPANADRRLAAQRQLADLLVEAKQWKEAYPLLQEVEKRQPEDLLLKEKLAACARELGEYDRARDLLALLLGHEERGSAKWYGRQLGLLELRVKKKEYTAALREAKDLLAGAPAELREPLATLLEQCQDAISREQARKDAVKARLNEVLAVYAQVEPARQRVYEKEVHDFGRDAADVLLDVLRSTRRDLWPAASALLGSLTGIVKPVGPDAAPEQVEKAIKNWQEWLAKPR